MEACIILRKIISQPKKYKASPLKRVWIPKPNSEEQRPLGIPTLIDRAVQAVYLMAIDPIAEEQSDPNSYGFRKHRSAHDAICRIRVLLDKRHSPTWVLDADIAKCFDRIDHDFLIENTVICDKTMLIQWLKCGITDRGVFIDTIMGTPQGGIISPMLCNIALNGLESAVKAAIPSTSRKPSKVHVTRYADDFVCTGIHAPLLRKRVKPAIADFLEKRGLEFSEAKTRIVKLDEGFSFLGFAIKREKWNAKRNYLTERHKQSGNIPENVLTVKPQPNKAVALKRKIREAITKYRPFKSILKLLNPLLRGWAEYFRISAHSTRTFRQVGHYVWYKMWRWARKKHHRKNHRWIDAKYLRKGGKRYWTFGITKKETLFDISTVTEKLVFPLKQGLNPYIQGNKEYYLKRSEKPKLMAPSTLAVYAKNGHNCSICRESLHNGEAVELHHIIPVKLGGPWTLENIQPLHKMCHASITNTSKSTKITRKSKASRVRVTTLK